MAEEYVILGNAGLALEIIEYMLREGKKVVGYYANAETEDCSACVPYLGDWRETFSRSFKYIIGAGRMDYRKQFIDFIERNDLEAGEFISSQSSVSSLARLGKGAVITPLSGISGNPVIGDYLYMAGFANIGHHAEVGDNVVMGPGSRINGHCVVGSNVAFGSNAALIPGTRVGDDAEIGLLTYPPKNASDSVLYMSSPGKRI